MGVYPFMFGSIKDFEPVAQEIIKVDHTSIGRGAHADPGEERPQGTLRLGRLCTDVLSQSRRTLPDRQGGGRGWREGEGVRILPVRTCAIYPGHY